MANHSFADLAYRRVVNNVAASDQGVGNQDVKALLLGGKKKRLDMLQFVSVAPQNGILKPLIGDGW